MNRFPTALVLACALLPTLRAPAQTPLTSSTPVIGFYKFDVPVGQSAWVVGLVGKKLFQGGAESVSPGPVQPDGAATTILTQAGAAWSANAFPLHYIEILTSGAQEGAILDVVTNTPNTLTVRGVISAAPNYCIRKHATLASVLPDAVSPAGAQENSGLVAYADSVTLYNSNNTVSSYFPASNGVWLAQDYITSANNTIIYPGQGFVLAASQATTLTIGAGEVAYVKAGPTKIPVYKGQTNFVGPINPMVITNPLDPAFNTVSSLAEGGGVTPLGTVGFTTSAFADYQDSITLFQQGGNLNPTGSFFTAGPNLIADDYATNSNAVPLRNGSALAVTVEVADRVLTITQQHPAN